MRAHYHVLSGLRGMYMPDGNEVFTSLRASRKYAHALALDWDTDGTDRMKQIGPGEYRSEGHAIWVTECTVADCLREG